METLWPFCYSMGPGCPRGGPLTILTRLRCRWSDLDSWLEGVLYCGNCYSTGRAQVTVSVIERIENNAVFSIERFPETIIYYLL